MAEENMNTTETAAESTAEQNPSTPTLAELQEQLEALRAENGKLKNAQSNASADASKYKKALQERMSEQERAEAETKELIASLRADNERMKHEQEVAVRTASYVGVGFDEILAKKAAEAYGSNHDDFMDAFKTFLAAHDKARDAEALRNTPRPGTSGSDNAVSKEEFNNMRYSERLKLLEEQPDVYNELVK